MNGIRVYVTGGGIQCTIAAQLSLKKTGCVCVREQTRHPLSGTTPEMNDGYGSAENVSIPFNLFSAAGEDDRKRGCQKKREHCLSCWHIYHFKPAFRQGSNVSGSCYLRPGIMLYPNCCLIRVFFRRQDDNSNRTICQGNVCVKGR